MDDNKLAKNRQNFWRHVSSNYYTKNTSQAKDRRGLIAQLVGLNKVESLLEIGCNSGGNLLAIADRSANPKNIVGIDISEDAIRYGREVEKNLANLLVGSAYDLDRFADKSFDLVFSCTCLIHIPSSKIPDILKEMIRIAKKYVINIETNGENAIRSFDGEIPHSFIHNFKNMYADAGFNVDVENVSTLLGGQTTGGADHMVICNLTNKKFKLAPSGSK